MRANEHNAKSGDLTQVQIEIVNGSQFSKLSLTLLGKMISTHLIRNTLLIHTDFLKVWQHPWKLSEQH